MSPSVNRFGSSMLFADHCGKYGCHFGHGSVENLSDKCENRDKAEFWVAGNAAKVEDWIMPHAGGAMGGFAEYDQVDGLGLAELVRRKEVTKVEVLEAAIARIEALNPKLNAVIRSMVELARHSVNAGLPSGPFRGVPILLKDLLAAYAGVPKPCEPGR